MRQYNILKRIVKIEAVSTYRHYNLNSEEELKRVRSYLDELEEKYCSDKECGPTE